MSLKLLLTSSGICNPSISDALVDLLGKPIAESTALFIPTGVYPFPGGAERAWKAIHARSVKGALHDVKGTLHLGGCQTRRLAHGAVGG